jgi:hypothetical protein
VQPGADSGTDTGSPVTDVTLDPPATPDDGWQFQVSSFSVDPGTEVQQCFFFKVPYDVPVFVNHIEIAQTTGTHHMNIFRVRVRWRASTPRPSSANRVPRLRSAHFRGFPRLRRRRL